MPLMHGKSRQVIGENISEMKRSGHSEAQAVAASLNQARKSGAKIPKKGKKKKSKKGMKTQHRISGQKKNANEAEKQGA
jgi:hypothetical protein